MVQVSLGSTGAWGPPSDPTGPRRFTQSAAAGFSDLSPSILSLRGAGQPFPTLGDPTRPVTLEVLNLQGASSLSISVGGANATLCSGSSGVPLDAQGIARALAAGGPTVWTISFLVPPGQGRGVGVVVTRWRGGEYSLSDAGGASIDYLPPLLLLYSTSGPRTGDSGVRPITLASGGVGGTVVNISTDSSETLSLLGTNLGTAPYLTLLSFATPTPLTPPKTIPFTSLTLPCPPGSAPAAAAAAASLYCLSFPAPPGVGTAYSLLLFAGNQATPPLPLTYTPAVVGRLVPLDAPPPGSPPEGISTEGGQRVLLTGSNFGPPDSLLPFAIAFGPPTQPSSTWAQCGDVRRTSHTSATCTLPQGSGAGLSVGILTGNVLGTTAAVFSFAPPLITGVTCGGAAMDSGSGSGVLVVGNTSTSSGLVNGGCTLTPTPSLAFPLVRSPTRGGALVTILGHNFGAPAPTAHCAFWTWAQRPADAADPPPGQPLRAHTCNGGEDWLGEGEVDATLVVFWSHRAITLSIPPGLGEKELQLNVGGVLLQARRALPNSTATPPTVPRLRYADPIVLNAYAPAYPGQPYSASGGALLVPTDGGSLVLLNGSNFGPPVFNVTAPGAQPLPSQFFSPPQPLLCTQPTTSSSTTTTTSSPCAPSLENAYPTVLFHRACVAYGFTPTGSAVGFTVQTLSAGAVPLLSSAGVAGSSLDGTGIAGAAVTGVSTASCSSALFRIDHETLAFASAPGVGTGRNLSLSIVLASGMEQRALPALTFSYLPPQITRFDPSVVRLRAGGGGAGAGGGASVVIWGRNFGNAELAVEQAWSVEDLLIGAALGGVPCLSVLRSRVEGSTVITCAIDTLAVRVGYSNASVQVAGQSGFLPSHPTTSALLLACDVGFYGRPNETCLPCPAANPNPALNGAFCRGYQEAAPRDDASARFPYPAPLPGWFNLNSSDSLTSRAGFGSMLGACPAAFTVAGRDVCIVPCQPTASCAGDNFCAPGYVSKPPMFRCASCDRGFFLSAGQCILCPASPVALVVVVALVLVCGAGALFYLNKHQVNIAVISIGVDYFQVLAMFASMAVQWPAPILALMRFLSAFNLNIEIVAPECLIPNLSYTYKFAFIMTLPLAIAAVFALAYAWLVVWKRCLRGIRDRRKVYSHRPALFSSTLVLFYLMYLYLTRTVLDVFDCTPTVPPDGNTYLRVVFEQCGVAGGTQLTLLVWALAGLGFYSLGYPIFLARALLRNKELIYEDQLLRAKGVGGDRLTNPHALELRRIFGRSYFAFRPRWYAWSLVILARKFCIACVAVIFSTSVGFQMASCLMIMFLAYTLQVQVRPYMAPDDYAGELKAFRAAVEAQEPLALRLKATLDSIESRGRKRTPPRPVLGFFMSGSIYGSSGGSGGGGH